MVATAKKVLIVEDDPVVRDLLKLSLESEGYVVLVAPNGIKLMSMISVDHPDALILDIMLPWIDGYELCRTIKSRAELSSIPIIFISAKASRQDIDRGYACGADAYFTKPLELADLSSKIDELISARSFS
jgi:DNA-binding response OmpR family regulator